MVSKESVKKVSKSSRPIQIGFSAETRELNNGLDIRRLLIKHPAATFFFRLTQGGILTRSSKELDPGRIFFKEGDILIIDRSADPIPGSITLFVHDETFFLGIYGQHISSKSNTSWYKKEDLSSYGSISDLSATNTERGELSLWGVVTGMIRELKGGV